MTDENDAVRDKKKKTEQMPLLFDDFETAQKIAERMIPKDHQHLSSAKIRYICRNKAARRAGNPVPGNVYKMGGKFAFLVGFDFIIEIALEVWNDLRPNQRDALIDHLLSRCQGTEKEEDGSMVWKLIPPPVQEFPEVAERHGQWHEGLVEFEKCLRTE
ncbi:MAG: putative metallopeptidase [Lentisphaeria bacterium]|jgi:hypothetical protein